MKLLILALITGLLIPLGTVSALAEETDPTKQTEQTDQTEQTEATTPAEPAFPVFSEPSSKRGLQAENEYRVYYTGSGYLKTGWTKVKKAVYYFRPEATGGPRGSAVTGVQQIDGYSYYFDETGVLQTGWQTIGNKRYYFEPSGAPGTLGRMYIGLVKIGNSRYYFDEKGRMRSGWITCKNKKFFFTKGKKSKNYGAAYTGWHTISGAKYYFKANGVMKKSCWIGRKYYVDADGKMLKSCVTPDGYLVDAQGVRGKQANGFVRIGKKVYYYSNGQKAVGLKKIKGKRYYFKPNGVQVKKGLITVGANKYCIKDGVIQTGWVVYDGKRYYFKKNGKMATDTVVDGVSIGADGTPLNLKFSVLLIAGHGQGDIGARGVYGSTIYYEQNLTREFATLIQKQLKAIAPGISVTMYDQNYNCYQVMSGRSSGPKVDYKQYDYVLEVHFNATTDSLKDSTGDGRCKGVGMYVNSAKQNTAIDEQIVAAVAQAAGYPIWGGTRGISRAPLLYNARTAQGLGVSYGLLETAFIDDRDDMKVYTSKKKQMAKAVATAIRQYFGV